MPYFWNQSKRYFLYSRKANRLKTDNIERIELFCIQNWKVLYKLILKTPTQHEYYPTYKNTWGKQMGIPPLTAAGGLKIAWQCRKKKACKYFFHILHTIAKKRVWLGLKTSEVKLSRRLFKLKYKLNFETDSRLKPFMFINRADSERVFNKPNECWAQVV